MNESEYMKEARRLADDLRQQCATLRQKPVPLAHLIPLMQRAADALSHIAKGERNYELIPPSAAEWFASCSAIANQDWRGGWDACRNRARALLDASVAKGGQARNAGVMVVPTDPVREAEIELADMQQNGDADDVLAAQINLEGVRHAAARRCDLHELRCYHWREGGRRMLTNLRYRMAARYDASAWFRFRCIVAFLAIYWVVMGPLFYLGTSVAAPVWLQLGVWLLWTFGSTGVVAWWMVPPLDYPAAGMPASPACPVCEGHGWVETLGEGGEPGTMACAACNGTGRSDGVKEPNHG